MGFDHYILWSGVCEKIQYMLEICQKFFKTPSPLHVGGLKHCSEIVLKHTAMMIFGSSILTSTLQAMTLKQQHFNRY